MLRGHRLRGEEGSVLVIAIILMSFMLSVGLASFRFVDTQQQRSREQRERETSLNLAEGVLYSQGFALAQRWPGNAAGGAAVPLVCTSASVQDMCPDPNTLAAGNSSSPAAANFTSADVAAAVTWETRIRDNGAPLFDSFDLARADEPQSGCGTGACRWDANGDRKLWVQARAVVRGQPRNLLALLKREQFAEGFAQSAVTAGSFEVSNSGNKTIINAGGSQVVVRCTTSGTGCTDYDPAKAQVLPSTIVRDPAVPPAMSDAQIERMKASAQSASPSTYYTSCPASLTGTVVFIDVPTGTSCTDSGAGTYNSPSEPGIVIMPRGSLTLRGTLHGLIYMANGQASAGPVLTLASNSQLFGGLAIDGPGRLVVGQASGQRATITYVANAFTSLRSFGTTALVQNTWRELPPQ